MSNSIIKNHDFCGLKEKSLELGCYLTNKKGKRSQGRSSGGVVATMMVQVAGWWQWLGGCPLLVRERRREKNWGWGFVFVIGFWKKEGKR